MSEGILTPGEEPAWIDDYFARYQRALQPGDVREQMIAFRDLVRGLRESRGKLIFSGNGASAGIASHGAVDFSKQGGVHAIDFNEPNLITALSNDYGFEVWIVNALRIYAQPGDAVVLISSSGRSANVVNAAKYARERGLKVVTFTGFAADNPLKALGDINFWVDSRAYNVVECTHMIWMTMVCDMVIGRVEYSTN